MPSPHTPRFDLARVEQAARRYGTPLFLYDLARLERQYRNLRSALPPAAEVFFALKANGSLGLCRRLAELGCGAEVSSLGELATAKAAGVPAARMIASGPAKSLAELRAAVSARVAWVVVESEGEAERLSLVAAEQGRVQPVLARLHPSAQLTGEGLAIARGECKFGIPEERAEPALARILELPGLRLEGIHVYTESGVLDASRLLASHGYVARLALRLRRAGFPLKVVDFGGGLGVPYREGEAGFDLEAYATGFAGLLAELGGGWRCLFEPGRYLVAECGALAMRVLDVRDSGSRRFVLVDAGIHRLYRSWLAQANRWLEVVGGGNREARTVTLAGPLPSPQDVLVEDVALPSPEVGDLLLLRGCGAYAYHHSLLHFTLRPTAAEVALDGDGLWLLRRPGSAEDFLRDQFPASSDSPGKEIGE